MASPRMQATTCLREDRQHRIVVAQAVPVRSGNDLAPLQPGAPRARREDSVAVIRGRAVSGPAQRLRERRARVHRLPASHQVELTRHAFEDRALAVADGNRIARAADSAGDVEVASEDQVCAGREGSERVENRVHGADVAALASRAVDGEHAQRAIGRPGARIQLASGDPPAETAHVDAADSAPREEDSGSPPAGDRFGPQPGAGWTRRHAALLREQDVRCEPAHRFPRIARSAAAEEEVVGVDPQLGRSSSRSGIQSSGNRQIPDTAEKVQWPRAGERKPENERRDEKERGPLLKLALQGATARVGTTLTAHQAAPRASSNSSNSGQGLSNAIPILPRRLTLQSPGTAQTTRPTKGTCFPPPSIAPWITEPGGNTRIVSVQKPPADTSLVKDTAVPRLTLKRRRWRSPRLSVRMIVPPDRLVPTSSKTPGARRVRSIVTMA